MEDRTVAIMGRVLDQDDGLGVYSLNLLRALFALDRRTRYVLLLQSSKHADSFGTFPNCEPLVLPTRSKLLWDQWTALRAAEREGAQLIFNPKFSIPLLAAIPCMFVQQGADWYVNPANYPWWDNAYIRVMLPLYTRKATKLVAISQATLDDLKKHAGIACDGAVVTYAGIAPNFTPARNITELANFRMQHRLPERFIFTVARTYHIGTSGMPPYPGGNNERLIRGYQRYRRAGGLLPLVVAGARIEEYLRARGFSDADLAGIHFLGFVPNTAIHLAFQLAECFVLATLCESFGFPIVEAFATGCPAIVPITCASPEIAGGAARLVDPRDETDIAWALAEVTGSETLRAQLSAAGLQRASFFTWRATAERTLAVFNEMVPFDQSLTNNSFSTAVTPGAAHAAHSASSRSAQD